MRTDGDDILAEKTSLKHQRLDGVRFALHWDDNDDNDDDDEIVTKTLLLFLCTRSFTSEIFNEIQFHVITKDLRLTKLSSS